MELTKEQVQQIAVLARLDLEENEVERLSTDLSKILGHIEELSKLDTENVAPTAHVGPVATPLREDEPKPCLDPEDALRNAPDRKGTAFRVPRIIE